MCIVYLGVCMCIIRIYVLNSEATEIGSVMRAFYDTYTGILRDIDFVWLNDSVREKDGGKRDRDLSLLFKGTR